MIPLVDLTCKLREDKRVGCFEIRGKVVTARFYEKDRVVETKREKVFFLAASKELALSWVEAINNNMFTVDGTKHMSPPPSSAELTPESFVTDSDEKYMLEISTVNISKEVIPGLCKTLQMECKCIEGLLSNVSGSSLKSLSELEKMPTSPRWKSTRK